MHVNVINMQCIYIEMSSYIIMLSYKICFKYKHKNICIISTIKYNYNYILYVKYIKYIYIKYNCNYNYASIYYVTYTYIYNRPAYAL